MIALAAVSKWYDGHVKVLDDVNFKINRGGFLYVVGGSGAGKSSLLKILSTEESPSAGNVSLFGYSLSELSPSTLRAMRREVGYVPQNVRLIPDLSVFDNVALALRFSSKKRSSAAARADVLALLEILDLTAKQNEPASALSGGEGQRVAVARALVRSPDLIIADEPTGAQDREHTWTLMDLFVRYNQKGSTVIIATHDREIVRRVRKQCAVLKGGHIVFQEGLCFF